MTSTEMRNYFFFCEKCSLRQPVVEKLPFMMSQRSTRQASKSNESLLQGFHSALLFFPPTLDLPHLSRKIKGKNVLPEGCKQKAKYDV